MGEFKAGAWILGICIYYFIFYLICLSVVNAQVAMDETPNIEFSHSAFGNSSSAIAIGNTSNYLNGSTISADTEYSMSGMQSAVSLMTGFSADIGLPSWARFIYSFIFFWIEFFILLYALYMSLPFLH